MGINHLLVWLFRPAAETIIKPQNSHQAPLWEDKGRCIWGSRAKALRWYFFLLILIWNWNVCVSLPDDLSHYTATGLCTTGVSVIPLDQCTREAAMPSLTCSKHLTPPALPPLPNHRSMEWLLLRTLDRNSACWDGKIIQNHCLQESKLQITETQGCFQKLSFL